MAKAKLQLEYTINVLPSVLYPYIATPSGLTDWFADEVVVDNDHYIFRWKDSEERATLISSKNAIYVRFRREEDESIFEFKITEDELTADVSLTVIDFCEEDEIEDMSELWTAQIDSLKKILGV